MKKKIFRCSICRKEVKDLKKSWVIIKSNAEDFLDSLGSPPFDGYFLCLKCYHSFLLKLKNLFDEVKNG